MFWQDWKTIPSGAKFRFRKAADVVWMKIAKSPGIHGDIMSLKDGSYDFLIEHVDTTKPLAEQIVIQEPTKVWFHFGWGEPQRFDFETEKEMDAFIQGVSAAAIGFGDLDYRQFDSQEEVDKFFANQ